MAIPRDALSLTMGMYSGTKDDYGKEAVPPLPLPFDRVNEGRAPTSSMLLFRMPLEIISLILSYVPTETLPALALVNRDCRQLARSRQFASIQLDYSKGAFDLIFVLLEESFQRFDNKGKTKTPSLGACIRRITMATNPDWITYRHGIGLDDGLMALSAEERNQRRANANANFFDAYIPLIERILADPSIMPHLELLDWEDKVVLRRLFFDRLLTSNVKHLKLFRVGIEEAFVFGNPKVQQWPLRTLHLEMSASLNKIGELDISPTCARILLLCASTLESLTWISSHNKAQFSFGDDMSDPIPRFLRLRILTLEVWHQMDLKMWNALVTDGLQILKADTDADSSSVEFFQNCGTIPSLDTFVWRTHKIAADHPLDFLRANPQLKQLSLEWQAPPVFLEKQLLPMLSESFTCLTSLSLRWDGTSIPLSALEAITSLKRLQKLHLSAGERFGWKHNWLIDHNSIRSHLEKLPRLQKLAFSRDSYAVRPLGDIGYTEGSYSRYYISQCLPDKYWRDNEEVREHRWEQIHRGMILGEAHQYMRVLPSLDWVYFGQLPMRVTYSAKKKKKIVETLSEERDDCWTFLREMFDAGAD